MDTVISVFKKVADLESITLTELERVLGASKGVLTKSYSKNTDISGKWLYKLAENYPQYNIFELLQNKQILKFSSIAEEPKATYQKEVINLNQIPYYDVDVFGSAVEAFNDQTVNPTFYLKIPGFNDCDFACNIYGLSMSPVYDPGDVIICKRMSGNLVLYGEVYLIITAELRTVKRIMPHTDDSKYLLTSFNADYPPVVIEKSAILHLYLVKGKIHQNNM